MARNEIHVPCLPERVFDVLADPRAYGEWVVGSKRVREIEGRWPEIGARFHHQVGWGPLRVSDHTEVIDVDPPRMLKLRAKARPLGTAEVTMLLVGEGDGTRVVMLEDPGDRISALVFNPLTHLLVRGRNVESLQRLRSIAVEFEHDPEAAERRMDAAEQP